MARTAEPFRPETFDYALDPATGVATLTFTRPERLNSLTFEVYAELRDAFRRLDTERVGQNSDWRPPAIF